MIRKLPFFYGWVIVAASGSAMFASMVLTTQTFSVFVRPMSEEFGWGRGLTSGAISVGTLCGMASAPLIGRLVDRYGSRLTLAFGAVATGSAAVALGFTETVAMFYLFFGVGRMVQQGGTLLAAPTAVANWFVSRRVLALTVMLLAERFGLATLPLLAQVVINITGSWRAGWYLLGVVSLAIGVLPPLFLVRRRPEDVGLLPDGIQKPKVTDAEVVANESLLVEPRWTAREAMHTRALWMVSAAVFAFATFCSAIVVHQVSYLIDREISATNAAIVVTVYAAGMAGGLVLWGYLANRIPVRLVLAIAMTSTILPLSLLVVTGSSWMAFLYAALMGAAFGSMGPLLPILWGSYFGRFSLGTIIGVTRPFHVMGNAAGPIIAGIVFDFTGTYMWAFWTLAAVCLAMAAVVTQARPPDRPFVSGLRD